MKIAIASENKEKIMGITEGVMKFFKKSAKDINVIYAGAESGVPEQPFNDDIFKGAKNRVENLKKNLENQDLKYDYYIACETGIVKLLNAYYNVQIVIIEDKSGKQWSGQSEGWQIPSTSIPEIKQEGLDTYLRKLGFNSSEEFLGNKHRRSESICIATEMALKSREIEKNIQQREMENAVNVEQL